MARTVKLAKHNGHIHALSHGRDCYVIGALLRKSRLSRLLNLFDTLLELFMAFHIHHPFFSQRIRHGVCSMHRDRRRAPRRGSRSIQRHSIYHIEFRENYSPVRRKPCYNLAARFCWPWKPRQFQSNGIRERIKL